MNMKGISPFEEEEEALHSIFGRGKLSTATPKPMGPTEDKNTSIGSRAKKAKPAGSKAIFKPATDKTRKAVGIAGSGRGNATLYNHVPTQQRCLAKITYIKNGGAGHWRQHGRYLEREGAQKESQKGVGFNAQREDIQISSLLGAWQRADDQQMFKIMLSPEFGTRLNMNEFVIQAMRKIEADLGTKLQWVGMAHYNTSHPHVHLCVRGVDEDGHPLIIHPNYIKEGVRMRAQEVATQMLGYRLSSDVQAARDAEIKVDRVTSLDKEIAAQIKQDNTFELEPPNTLATARKNYQLAQRLDKLQEMGLAKKVGDLWLMEPGFLFALQKLSRTKDRQKALAQFQSFVEDKDAPIYMNRLEKGWLLGRVLGSGLDEQSDKLYSMLEGSDGKIHYITYDKMDESNPPLIPGKVAVFRIDTDKEFFRTAVVEQYDEIPAHIIEKMWHWASSKGKPLPTITQKNSFANRVSRALHDLNNKKPVRILPEVSKGR